MDEMIGNGAAGRTLLALTLLCTAAVPGVSAQRARRGAAPSAEQGAFVVRIGTDTLAVERFARRANQLEGTLVVRSPRTALRRYTALLRPDGSVSRFDVTLGSPANPAEQRVSLVFRGDSISISSGAGDSTRTMRIAAGSTAALPYLPNSYALYEQALLRARRAGADSLRAALLTPGAVRTSALVVQLEGDTGAVFTNASGPAHARTDARGRLLSLNGAGTTQQFLVDRVPGFDVEAFAAASAARDAAGQALGVLSPRDTVNARVAGAELMVDYGRPARRGRVVMGQVVPWGRVWRTGANAATQLRTSRDLVIGGAAVPAGTYTLFTLPTPEGWTLIINRQTGQWGTAYDPAQDLARVPMTSESLPSPVERFTIAVEPAQTGGTLALMWENTRVMVPFAVR